MQRKNLNGKISRFAGKLVVAMMLLQNFAFALPAANAATQASGAVVRPMVAVGGNNSLALKSDGTVWAWGANYDGQLGNGSLTDSNSPVQASGLTGVMAIASGQNHSLALKSDGTVWDWGSNSHGQLGDGTTNDSDVPLQVSGGLSDVIAISAGAFHSVALKADGTVWTWGENNFGQLGNGNTGTDSSTPVQVSGLTGVRAIAGSFYHTLALKDDGTVWAWGYNNFGNLGDGTNSDSNVPVQVVGPGGIGFLTGVAAIGGAGIISVALKDDGTVWTWGYNNFGTLGDNTHTDSNTPIQVHGVGDVGFLTGVTSIGFSGYYNIYARISDGTVMAWGANFNGNLGDGTTTERDTPVQVSGLTGVTQATGGPGGGNNALAIKTDGTVWAWGANGSGQLGDGTHTNSSVPVQSNINLLSGTGMIAVAASGFHSLSLKADGTVRSWGSNSNGQLGNGTNTDSNDPVQVSGLTGVAAIAGGDYHSLALKSDGTVWAWGSNSNGQLGDGTTTDRNTPVQVSGLTGITAISGGVQHSLALKSDGTVWAWGWNISGQLGDGTTTDRNTPVQVTGLSGVIAIAAGSVHSLALESDGTVKAWGANGNGELGDGTNTSSNVPVTVSGLSGVIAIAGNYHSLALESDGTVRAWGADSNGQLGDGGNTDSNVPVTVSGLTGATAVAAGGSHSLALESDGTVRAWGADSSGQLGDGGNTDSNVPVTVSGLTGATAVAAADLHSLALIFDGTVLAWGFNDDGELGNCTNADTNTPVEVAFAGCPGPGGSTATSFNKILESRLKAGVTSDVTVSFHLTDNHDLADTVVTFPVGFTVTSDPTSGASSACFTAFSHTSSSVTATKGSCGGNVDLFIGGFQVTNPGTPGTYQIGWTNDDPGGADVYITSEDTISMSATVDPSITFDVGAQTAACDGSFSSSAYTVAFGSLSPSSVSYSDNSGVQHVCTKLSTNAAAGAVVTVMNANGASGLKSASVPTDVIPSASASMSSGVANYGLCATSTSGLDSTTPTGATPANGAFDPTGCGTGTATIVAFDGTAQTAWTAAGPVSNGFYQFDLNAEASATTPAHSDYADTLTWIATGTF